TAETQVPVRIVFQQKNSASDCPAKQREAALDAQRSPARIGEIAHDVSELGDRVAAVRGQRRFEAVHSGAIGGGGYLQILRTAQVEGLYGGQVGRYFERHPIPFIQERPRDEIEGLLRSGGDLNRVGAHPNRALRQVDSERSPQRLLAFGRAVLQR